MAIKIMWKPVLQALALKDYHPAFGKETIMVCVNPKPEFFAERTALMADYSRRLVEVQAALQAKAPDATEKNDAFNEWSEKTFLPGMQDWFARLWSFGEEQYTTSDINEYEQVDPHLATWLKRRSIEMIDEHAYARKKA